MVNFRLIKLVESRIHREVYVRFGGEYPKIRHRNMKMDVGCLAYGITRIYPNPVDDVATIESSEVIDVITVYNASGTMVDKQMNVNANTTAIDFSRFAKGLYFVKLNNQKAIKVIKK